MLIVVGQDQLIIEQIHGVYKCINQAFLKLTVCWIAMTELLKPCRHLFAGQLWPQLFLKTSVKALDKMVYS